VPDWTTCTQKITTCSLALSKYRVRGRIDKPSHTQSMNDPGYLVVPTVPSAFSCSVLLVSTACVSPALFQVCD